MLSATEAFPYLGGSGLQGTDYVVLLFHMLKKEPCARVACTLGSAWAEYVPRPGLLEGRKQTPLPPSPRLRLVTVERLKY